MLIWCSGNIIIIIIIIIINAEHKLIKTFEETILWWIRVQKNTN